MWRCRGLSIKLSISEPRKQPKRRPTSRVLKWAFRVLRIGFLMFVCAVLQGTSLRGVSIS